MVVVASAPGHAAALLRVDLRDPRVAAPDALTLALVACAARIVGNVQEADGRPIGGATVALLPGPPAPADAAGAYELCVQPGSWTIVARAPGYGGRAVVVPVATAGSEVRRDVPLTPQAAIVGRVVRADDGAPVAGAWVRGHSPVRDDRDYAASASALTDAEGRFQLDGVAASRFNLLATADGLWTPEPTVVGARLGTPPDEVVLRLVPAARIEGRVLEGGAPVVGASIGAIPKTSPRSRGAALTQADGSFAIGRLPPGRIALSVAGYEIDPPGDLEADVSPAARPTIVRVRRLGAVRGRVLQGGQPVAGALVAALDPAVGAVRSGRAGRYELPGLRAGTHSIFVSHRERGLSARPAEVTLGRGEQRELDLPLTAGAAIAGIVVDQQGQPVSAVDVVATRIAGGAREGGGGRARTDARGRFEIAALEGEGRYRLEVRPLVESTETLPVTGGEPPIVALSDGRSRIEGTRLEVRRERLALTGRVVGDDGEGIPDVNIQAARDPGDDPPDFVGRVTLLPAVTDAEGRFTIAVPAPGPYGLRFTGGGTAVVRRAPAGGPPLVVRLVPPGHVEGTIDGFAETPSIYAQPIDEKLPTMPAEIAGTRFRVPRLRPGRYLLTAQTLGEGVAQIVEVRPNETTTLALRSGGGGRLRVRVLDWATKRPVPGVRCHAVLRAGAHQGLTNWAFETAPTTDVDGCFVQDPAPAGEVRIACTATSTRISAAQADLVVPAGGEADATIYVVTTRGETTAGPLGLRIAPGPEPRIQQIDPRGAAAAAGLRRGDVVVGLDGASVAGLSGAGVAALVADRPPGPTSLRVVRDGAPLGVTIVPPRRSP